MRQYYADLHVHIGRAGGRPVKITASSKLTLEAVLKYAALDKGLHMVGVVDCGSPLVLQEIKLMLDNGSLYQTAKGDLVSSEGVTLILGIEMESNEGVHFLTYLPDLKTLETWQRIMARKMRNPNLSTQKTSLTAGELMKIALGLEGLFVVAHAFTPHKGAYGCWVSRLSEGLGNQAERFSALELGLSSDTDMAGLIKETGRFTFLSNSDAHSLGNLGREYNLLRLGFPGFSELKRALFGQEGRRVMANFGMHPGLGKYFRSYCPGCEVICSNPQPSFTCEVCSKALISGVWDRIMAIRDYEEPHHPVGRAVYNYRVPLSFIPGLGPRTYERLRQGVGNEIDIIERADLELIGKVAGSKIAGYLGAMRENSLKIIPGGGGKYGKIARNNNGH